MGHADLSPVPALRLRQDHWFQASFDFISGSQIILNSSWAWWPKPLIPGNRGRKSRPTWSTKHVPGQPGLYTSLSQKVKINKINRSGREERKGLALGVGGSAGHSESSLKCFSV